MLEFFKFCMLELQTQFSVINMKAAYENESSS